MNGSVRFIWMLVFLLLATSVLGQPRRPGSGTGGTGGSGGSTGGSGGSTGGSGGSTGGSGGSTGGSGGSTGGSGGSTGGSGGSTGGSGGSTGGSGGSTGGSGGQHTYPPSNGWSGTTYRPPQQIQHGSASFPVSQTAPPASVYQMRDSGSRYNSLATGLMLWNHARITSTVASATVCRFRLRYNGTTEYRRINCNSISSFIRDWENQANNTTTGNSTAEANVPGTGNITVIENDDFDTNSTIDVLDDRGQTILVTPGMVCHILRTRNRRTTSQEVDCMVLQLYTANSWQREEVTEGGGGSGGGSGGVGGGITIPGTGGQSSDAKRLTATLVLLPIFIFLRLIL